MTKQELRKINLAVRKDLPDRAEKNQQIHALLRKQPFYQKAKTVMTYLSYRSEPDTFALIEEMQKEGKTVCAPVCGKSGSMEAQVFSETEALIRSPMGILEPKNGVVICPRNIDLILVPGCGFNARGHRLGYGGGFYDRYLKRTSAITCGLFYEALKTEFIEEITDIPLHFAVTECKLYQF